MVSKQGKNDIPKTGKGLLEPDSKKLKLKTPRMG